MSENKMTELSDDQLAFEVRAVFGAGGGAAMEAIRRLSLGMDAISQSHLRYAQALRRLNTTLIIVGMVLIVLTAAQVAAAWPNLKAILSH
jgi:hypothetical protein